MTFGIYCIEHIDSGRKYVGKSKNIELRFQKHKSQLLQPEPKNGVNSYLWNLVNKYGIESLSFWIIEEVIPKDPILLADRETFWMDSLGTLDRANGFNLKRDSSSLTTFTDEMRKNISESKKGSKNPNFGKLLSEEHKAKLVKYGEANNQFGKRGELSPNYGVARSEKTRQRVSESKSGSNNPNYGKFGELNPLFGRKLSIERRKAMSDSRKGIPFPEHRKLDHGEATRKYSYESYTKDGKFFKFYRTPQDLKDSGALPPNVSSAIKYKQNHHGLYWVKVPAVSLDTVESYIETVRNKSIDISEFSSMSGRIYCRYSDFSEDVVEFKAADLKLNGYDISAVLKVCVGKLKSYKSFKWKFKENWKPKKEKK